MSFNEDDEAPKHKKRRGRPKKIKEEEIEELQHYDDEGELSCRSGYFHIFFVNSRGAGGDNSGADSES